MAATTTPRNPLGLRRGHWYTTSQVPDGAAVDRHGRAVAVYCDDRDALVFQHAGGHDLVISVYGKPVVVAVDPRTLADVAPLVEADDLPGDRKLGLPPGLKLA